MARLRVKSQKLMNDVHDAMTRKESTNSEIVCYVGKNNLKNVKTNRCCNVKVRFRIRNTFCPNQQLPIVIYRLLLTFYLYKSVWLRLVCNTN